MSNVDTAYGSMGGGVFDIKTHASVAPYGPNTGRLLGGRYATARSAGNFLAGFNAYGRLSFPDYMKLAGMLHQKQWTKINAGRVLFFGKTYGPAPWYGEIEYAGRINRMGYNYGYFYARR